jgi:hypothetical protein
MCVAKERKNTEVGYLNKEVGWGWDWALNSPMYSLRLGGIDLALLAGVHGKEQRLRPRQQQHEEAQKRAWLTCHQLAYLSLSTACCSTRKVCFTRNVCFTSVATAGRVYSTDRVYPEAEDKSCPLQPSWLVPR